ncbi:hypothetical protein DCAR_0209783 [Daucus carota subsp. sativus]|uniref:Long-chain-fatty-acid--CoA ligase n=1 Tax=Daucus carota subsp. sativus TaxID=79200 RepID=A0AAF1APB7_DAUCS|nr:hypothetical protein DCAR_0209783 [Daucus carota subsp. sativus]
MAQKRFVVEVEEAKEAGGGRPLMGPVYRNVLAKDGFRPPAIGIESCWDMFRVSAEKYPENQMLGQREIVKGEAGKYAWLTYKQVYDMVLQVGASIRVRGAHQGARCGIYGPNCTKWVISMQACNAYGLYCVPLYDTLGSGAVEYIICHAEISIVFADETKLPELLKTLPSVSKHLKTLVSFGKITSEQKAIAHSFALPLFSWDEFLLLGIGKEFELPAKKKSDVCTIMYTSGTTGDPKGVMITNESIIWLISGVNHHLGSINAEFTEKDVYLSYLPLAHIFDRVMEEQIIFSGASIGFWQGNIKLLMNDVKELKPSIFCAVPRVLDKIYSGLVEKISSGGLIKKSLFNIAYSYKLENMRRGYKHGAAAPIFDKIVFSKVKEGLGGNMRLILSGAAPLSTAVETFLRVVTCADVLQGYVAMIGTVGPPLPSIDVCLESVPDMGYDALAAATPRGEICIRGRTLFSGYYKRQDLTQEVMNHDGWFHTGDIGEWQPDGSMKIIDRKKNIFKLSQGEYVSVENLENIYSLVSGIDAICIHGNSYESFLVAVANPNKEVLESWAHQNGVAGDFSTICDNPLAKAYLLGELTKIAKQNKLKGFEMIKAVHLDPVPFDMERGLLTPTFKKKRGQFLKYYQNVIDEMYTRAR